MNFSPAKYTMKIHKPKPGFRVPDRSVTSRDTYHHQSKRTTNDDDNLSKTIINEDEDKAASIDKNPSSGAKKLRD